jgi:hypothetical protein
MAAAFRDLVRNTLYVLYFGQWQTPSLLWEGMMW